MKNQMNPVLDYRIFEIFSFWFIFMVFTVWVIQYESYSMTHNVWLIKYDSSLNDLNRHGIGVKYLVKHVCIACCMMALHRKAICIYYVNMNHVMITWPPITWQFKDIQTYNSIYPRRTRSRCLYSRMFMRIHKASFMWHRSVRLALDISI